MNQCQAAFLESLKELKNEKQAEVSKRFFRTGKGEYGEGDIFWGISVPAQRAIARKHFQELDLEDLKQLVRNEVHEVRLSTLLVMILHYQKAKTEEKKAEVVKLYLDSLDYINNWDLVDLSAYQILGEWYLAKGWEPLKTMAAAPHLWTQRIAIVATYAFIRKGIFEPTLIIARMLLNHKHDLIHKAVGWMLREVGKRDFQTEYDFLLPVYKTMPRTMLRYAIEKFPEDLRQDFLKGSAGFSRPDRCL